MARTFKHLSAEERAVIMLERQARRTITAIAVTLGRCPGTISHESIYATIYAQPRGALKQCLIESLRHAKSKRGTRRTTAARARFVPEEKEIAHRPEEVDSRQKKLPQFLRQSMTYDRGSEMACHARLSKQLKLDIWFCDPHAPWQRGSNENTNGLLRQFLPKGMDLSKVNQRNLNDIARLLNTRPRKTLDWQTPQKVLDVEVEKFVSSGRFG